MQLRPFSSRPRGLFITVDGPSGAGKSTIIQHLAQLLVASGEHVHATAEPSQSPIGRLRRELTPQPDFSEVAVREFRPRSSSSLADKFVPVSEELPGGGIELSPAEIDALGARWSSCWDPGQVALHLAGIAAPWCVAAGWALDLFRGVQTRAHGDIEIAVPAARFPEVRERFPAYAFDAVGSGRKRKRRTYVCDLIASKDRTS